MQAVGGYFDYSACLFLNLFQITVFISGAAYYEEVGFKSYLISECVTIIQKFCNSEEVHDENWEILRMQHINDQNVIGMVILISPVSNLVVCFRNRLPCLLRNSNSKQARAK